MPGGWFVILTGVICIIAGITDITVGLVLSPGGNPPSAPPASAQPGNIPSSGPSGPLGPGGNYHPQTNIPSLGPGGTHDPYQPAPDTSAPNTVLPWVSYLGTMMGAKQLTVDLPMIFIGISLIVIGTAPGGMLGGRRR
jgi:hypothetical protein